MSFVVKKKENAGKRDMKQPPKHVLQRATICAGYTVSEQSRLTNDSKPREMCAKATTENKLLSKNTVPRASIQYTTNAAGKCEIRSLWTVLRRPVYIRRSEAGRQSASPRVSLAALWLNWYCIICSRICSLVMFDACSLIRVKKLSVSSSWALLCLIIKIAEPLTQALFHNDGWMPSSLRTSQLTLLFLSGVQPNLSPLRGAAVVSRRGLPCLHTSTSLAWSRAWS